MNYFLSIIWFVLSYSTIYTGEKLAQGTLRSSDDPHHMFPLIGKDIAHIFYNLSLIRDASSRVYESQAPEALTANQPQEDEADVKMRWGLDSADSSGQTTRRSSLKSLPDNLDDLTGPDFISNIGCQKTALKIRRNSLPSHASVPPLPLSPQRAESAPITIDKSRVTMQVSDSVILPSVFRVASGRGGITQQQVPSAPDTDDDTSDKEKLCIPLGGVFSIDLEEQDETS